MIKPNPPCSFSMLGVCCAIELCVDGGASHPAPPGHHSTSASLIAVISCPCCGGPAAGGQRGVLTRSSMDPSMLSASPEVRMPWGAFNVGEHGAWRACSLRWIFTRSPSSPQGPRGDLARQAVTLVRLVIGLVSSDPWTLVAHPQRRSGVKPPDAWNPVMRGR